MSDQFNFTLTPTEATINTLDFGDPAEVFKYLKSQQGIKLAGTFKVWHPRRSNEQRNFVMGIAIPFLMRELGYSPHEKDDFYNAAKLEFWYIEKALSNGKIMRIARKTRWSDTKEFQEFWQALDDWARDFHGIILPQPDPSKSRRYKNQKE